MGGKSSLSKIEGRNFNHIKINFIKGIIQGEQNHFLGGQNALFASLEISLLK